MSSEKFIKNKIVLITLVSACMIVIISLGIRQTFGLFYFDFSADLGITLSQFGFSLGLQMFLWGAFAPWFGFITDKYGGHIAVFIGFIFYLSGVDVLENDKLGRLSLTINGCKERDRFILEICKSNY